MKKGKKENDGILCVIVGIVPGDYGVRRSKRELTLATPVAEATSFAEGKHESAKNEHAQLR